MTAAAAPRPRLPMAALSLRGYDRLAEFKRWGPPPRAVRRCDCGDPAEPGSDLCWFCHRPDGGLQPTTPRSPQ